MNQEKREIVYHLRLAPKVFFDTSLGIIFLGHSGICLKQVAKGAVQNIRNSARTGNDEIQVLNKVFVDKIRDLLKSGSVIPEPR